MSDSFDEHRQSDRGDAAESRGREPAGLVETVLANCRPQPAIPALLVLFLTIVIAVFTYAPDTERSILALLIPAGIVVSCGLSIAAGFCSFFPPLGWLVVAWWALKFTVSGPLPAYNRYVLLASMAAAAIMLGVQGWRVATRRFIPTVPVDHEPI